MNAVFSFLVLLLVSLSGVNRPAAPVVVVVGDSVPEVQATIYGATWCQPCVKYDEDVLKLVDDGWTVEKAGTAKAKAALIVIDNREDAEAIKANKIVKYPTTIVRKNGKEVKRIEGRRIPKDDLADLVNAIGKKKEF